MPSQSFEAQKLQDLLTLEGHEFLAQAYLLLLGRRIDPAGLTSYLSHLSSGSGKAAILYAIHVSGEAVAYSGPHHQEIAQLLIEYALAEATDSNSSTSIPALLRLDGDNFVKAVFHRAARRPPYTDELAAFSAKASRAAEKLQVVEEIARAVLEKDPDARGALSLTAAVAEWRAGLYPTAKSIDDLLRLEDVAFVDCAYKTLLKRPPDIGGLTEYISLYRAGASKFQILRKMSRSPEGRRQRVQLAGVRRASMQRRMRALRIFSHLLSGGTEPAIIESGTRSTRALYRAICRLLELLRAGASLQDQAAQAVESLLRTRR